MSEGKRSREELPEGTDERTKTLSLSFRDYRDGRLPGGLWGLAALETLSLTGSALPAVPPLLARLTALTQLNLGNNELCALPPELCALRSLASLELSGNRFEALPPCVGDLPALRSLALARNRLAALPGPLLARLSRLESLVLAENALAELPPELGTLQRLRTLVLTGNAPLRTLPPALADLAALEDLQVSRTALAEVPACVYALPRLRKLDVSSCAIERFGEPLAALGAGAGLSALVHLNVSDNALQTLPVQIAALSHLETLDASFNVVSALPADLSGLSRSLCALVLRCNRISALPDSLFALEKLATLDLAYNDLPEIPAEGIARLPLLRWCVLFGNRFDCNDSAAISTALERVPQQQRSIVITQEPDPPAPIVPGLWLGSYNSARNRHGLRRRGVTHILTVASLLKPLYPQDFTYHVVRIEDDDEADLAAFFEPCIAFIDEALARGGGVLVHCAAGISRSATVVAAYLIARHKMTSAGALDHIKEKRPIVCPNLGFIAQLEKFERKKNKRLSNCKHQ